MVENEGGKLVYNGLPRGLPTSTPPEDTSEGLEYIHTY
jgi:hypothetical protein